jgi:thiol-disulfide isomerase/thioredoxin
VYSLDSFEDAKAVVVVFTCNHCPITKAYEDRLIEIAKTHKGRGAEFVAINPNDPVAYAEDNFENMLKRAQQKGSCIRTSGMLTRA